MKVHLIGHMPFGSSIFRYGLDISRSVTIPVSYNMFSLRPSFSKSPIINFRNLQVFNGRRFFLSKLEPFVNYAFIDKIFQTNISQITVDLENTLGIVHYLDHLFPPIKMFNDSYQVVTIHDNIYNELNFDNFFYKNIAMKLAKKFKKFQFVLVNSNYVRNALTDHGFEGKIVTIYYPVSPEFKIKTDKNNLRKKYGLPTDKKLILSVSTDAKRKNLKVVKETTDRLGSNFALVRIGNKLGNSYSFSSLNYDEISDIYNACDILLMPSLEEGFGLPVIEAMACGTPVVASDIPAISEISNGSAILVEPDVNHCVNGVKEALVAHDELSRKGLQRARAFSIELFGEKMTNFYTSIIKDSIQ